MSTVTTQVAAVELDDPIARFLAQGGKVQQCGSTDKSTERLTSTRDEFAGFTDYTMRQGESGKH